MQATLHICKRYCDTVETCGKLLTAAEDNPLKEYLVFCEDKLTLSVENCILDNLKSKGAFNISVCTFARYLSKKTKLEKVLSKEAAAMVIRRIIYENTSDLLYLGKNSAKNTAENMYELIAQLKSSKITPSLLKTFEGGDAILKNKLCDIILIYQKYNEFLNSGYYDESSYLELLPKIIEQDKNIGDTEVFLVGFPSFTRQAAAIVECLIRNAASVSGIFCGGNEEVYTNEAAGVLIKVCAELGFTPKTINSFSSANAEAGEIIKNLYNPFLFKAKNPVQSENVFLYEAENYDDEIIYLCEQIRKEIDDNGLRYKDIVVLTDLTATEITLKKCFAEYNIPCFFDEKKSLAEHPLSLLFISYLQIVENDFTVKDSLSFIKNIFFFVDRNISDGFENYILKYENYRGFLKKELKKYGNQAENYEILRKNAYNLIKISKKMKAFDFCSALKNLALSLNIEEKINALTIELQGLNEQSSAYNKQLLNSVYEILDKICEIMPDVEMSVSEFKGILLSGMTAKTVSLLPAYSDAIFAGGYDSKAVNAKALFCLNLNSSVPFQKADTAIITDKDIIKLKNFDVVIEPKIEVINMRQRENTALAIASFSKRLYLSYSLLDSKGKEQRKSDILNYIKAMFIQGGKTLPQMNRDFLKSAARENISVCGRRFYSPLPALKNFISDAIAFKEGNLNEITAASSFYFSAEGHLKKEADRLLKLSDLSFVKSVNNGKQLFTKNGYISATLLQNYFECPYKNFLRMGLKIKERDISEIKPNDCGNFLHEVMEKAFVVLDALDSRESIDEFCDEVTAELLNKEPYLIMKRNPASLQAFMRLKKEAARIISALKRHSLVTAFKPLGREVPFGYPDAEIPPLCFNTDKGKIMLCGIIDRLDVSDGFIRIIDYKSGKIDKNDLSADYYTGKKLQLWLYLNAVKDGYTPCGGYYFDLNDDFNQTDDISNYKMTGITLLDDEVLEKTDSSISSDGDALTVNIKVAKDKIKGDVLSRDEFDNYLKYSLLVSEKAAEQIADGVIIPSPYKKCGYCEYQSVCGYDESDGELNRTPAAVKPDFIAEAAKKGGEI